MREIKFRAFGGYPATMFQVETIIWNKCIYDKYGTKFNLTIPLMQFTGLYDKNEKEIYEGDLVKSTIGITEVKWEDQWDDCECSFCGYSFPVINPKYVEVVGNIYENTELLEK